MEGGREKTDFWVGYLMGEASIGLIVTLSKLENSKT